jgi:hypothetical protein
VGGEEGRGRELKGKNVILNHALLHSPFACTLTINPSTLLKVSRTESSQQCDICQTFHGWDFGFYGLSSVPTFWGPKFFFASIPFGPRAKGRGATERNLGTHAIIFNSQGALLGQGQ